MNTGNLSKLIVSHSSYGKCARLLTSTLLWSYLGWHKHRPCWCMWCFILFIDQLCPTCANQDRMLVKGLQTVHTKFPRYHENSLSYLAMRQCTVDYLWLSSPCVPINKHTGDTVIICLKKKRGLKLLHTFITIFFAGTIITTVYSHILAHAPICEHVIKYNAHQELTAKYITLRPLQVFYVFLKMCFLPYIATCATKQEYTVLRWKSNIWGLSTIRISTFIKSKAKTLILQQLITIHMTP